MKARTMVYLERDELEALRAKARKERISLAEAVRRAVRMSLEGPLQPRPVVASAYAAVVGLGASGRTEIGRRHDAEIAVALRSRGRAR